MVPEEKAALIVWRIMVPSVPFEECERELLAAEAIYLQAAMEEAL